MFSSKEKKAPMAHGKRVLIKINVVGSAGPLRMVVGEEEVVVSVISMALKSYAREGRLPILGSDLNDFLLYCPAAGPNALMNPLESIKSRDSRNFILCQKPQEAAKDAELGESGAGNGEDYSMLSRWLGKKSNGRWKTWINKSLSLKIASRSLSL